MGSHFTWFDLFEIEHHMTAVAAAIFTTCLIILLCIAGRLALGGGDHAVTPAARFSLKGFFEAYVEFMDDLSTKVLGHDGRAYLPLFGSMFFYIVFSNLIGLIPGLTSPTSNINAAFAIGLFSFVTYNIMGVRHAGAGYLKHFMGPVWWMAPVLLPIELLSNFIRPLTLGIRLSVNMTADHTILGTFIDMTKVIIPVIFYGMGTFVSLIQAFVFTMLSMVYVLMATADQH
jgi:F-type H+-transporting ATPase subunit a